MTDLRQLKGPIVICAPTVLPALYADDLHGDCALCGARVRFRPYIPNPHTLVCLVCFILHAEPGKGAWELMPETLEELRELAQALGPDVPRC